MGPQDLLRGRDSLRVEIREQQVLLSSETDAGPEPGDDLVQRLLDLSHDAAALDEHSIEEAGVGLAVASQVVVERKRRKRDWWRQSERGAPLELVPKPLQPPFSQQV